MRRWGGLVARPREAPLSLLSHAGRSRRVRQERVRRAPEVVRQVCLRHLRRRPRQLPQRRLDVGLCHAAHPPPQARQLGVEEALQVWARPEARGGGGGRGPALQRRHRGIKVGVHLAHQLADGLRAGRDSLQMAARRGRRRTGRARTCRCARGLRLAGSSPPAHAPWCLPRTCSLTRLPQMSWRCSVRSRCAGTGPWRCWRPRRAPLPLPACWCTG